MILIAEFWNAPGGRTLELFKLYPHMALMPSLLFWAVFWMAASSLGAAWKDKSLRPKIMRSALLCLLITMLVTYQEVTSSPIMLFELRPDRGSDSTWSTLYANTREMLKKPRPQPAPDETTEEQVKMDQSLSHDYWRDKHRFSITRPFYIAAFFLSIFALANVVAGLSYFPELSAKEEDRYLFQLLGGFFCYALWFPARFYYNLEIKSTLVGSSEKLPGRDIVLYFVGAGFLVFVCVRLISEVDRFRRIGTLLGVFALPLISVFATKSLGNVFGLSSKPLTWVTLFGVFLFLFTIFRSVLPVPEGLAKRSHRRIAQGREKIAIISSSGSSVLPCADRRSGSANDRQNCPKQKGGHSRQALSNAKSPSASRRLNATGFRLERPGANPLCAFALLFSRQPNLHN
ncbi:MAG TPA: hypothetical protein VGW57_15535 [Chthoniobacterales bacterium]|nr:hypothetical protein [Chthoniobacterales bacterium]